LRHIARPLSVAFRVFWLQTGRDEQQKFMKPNLISIPGPEEGLEKT
jgi:hypothetical protein